MPHALQLLLILATVVAAAKLAGGAANRFGQPAVFGEILAGLLLGPTLLDVLAWPAFAAAQDGHASLGATIQDFAEVGVVLLMFVAGLETDLAEMRRVGKVATWAAAGGVLLPLAGGMATAAAFGMPALWQGVFVGTILTATSVSISAQTLMELGVLKSKEGSTILGAAVIDDVMGIVLLSLVVAFAQTTGRVDLAGVAIIIGRMVAFFALAIGLGAYFDRITAWADRLGVSQGLLAAVVLVAFLYAWAAEYVGGVAAITGAYLAGVLFTRTRFKRLIDEGIHPLTYSVFVPVFFISIGLRANGRELGAQAAFTVVLVLVAIVAKAIGCGVVARVLGFTTRQATRVGVGMISRGEVGLIVAGYGLSHGIIGRDVFSASVIVVLATTMITPPLLRLTYPGRTQRPGVVLEEAIAAQPVEVHEHQDVQRRARGSLLEQ